MIEEDIPWSPFIEKSILGTLACVEGMVHISGSIKDSDAQIGDAL